MPHQCTECGRSFADGSTEMLSGCPDCGGTTFQYRPDGADAEFDPSESPPDPPDRPGDSSVARTVGNAATAVRDLVGSDPGSPEEPEKPSDSASSARPEQGIAESSTATPEHIEEDAAEDAAQASARSEVVSPEDLPQSHTERPTPVLDEESEPTSQERPALQTLREELNDQFESIKVLEPGQYELNLMELYDREEYIIALQEDGKYTIQVPERWKGE